MMKRMNFDRTWKEWIKAIIFSKYISILVNDNPTKDFKAHRGLRQRDPLSLFLFMIVTEGIAGLIKKASVLGVFKGFNFKGLYNVDLLQFTDDTLIIGEGSWNNL